MIEYQKVKSVAKKIEYKGDQLDNIILDTMHRISSVVGATLGPGGNPVLIERYEHDLPPTLTKDGVTVFRSIGFENSVAHVIMESARDSSIRTASEAGDGTTTCAILADSIVTKIKEYCKKNPRVSPQKIMRRLDKVFATIIEPTIKKASKKIELDEKGQKLLKGVARLSANGDDALADAVMQCFEVTGDDGNVTITEHSGPSKYLVEEIDGFPIGIGYEMTAKQFWTQFINDPGNQRTVLDKPLFLLYNGKLTEYQSLIPILNAVATSCNQQMDEPGKSPFSNSVVVIATGFSDTVLAALAGTFPLPHALNVVPLITPQTVQQGSEFEFLHDVAGITGASVFDPLTCPLHKARVEHLGSGIQSFEYGRYRSNIIGISSEEKLKKRIEEVKVQRDHSISELDKNINNERLAKLMGGIAKLQVYGSSNGETKEKRDRAEDAICAVRGALRHGCLPGGAWTLLKVITELPVAEDDICKEILVPALQEPFKRLVSNCGMTTDEGDAIMAELIGSIFAKKKMVYDFLDHEYVNPYKTGILDSTPAVLEAVRNSLSIAGRLGTLGGVIVQYRDQELERKEAGKTIDFNRMTEEDINPANFRP